MNNFINSILFPVKTCKKKNTEKVIKGKTILITGASHGIGECIVRSLSSYEVTLIITARSEEKLQELKKELQNKQCKIHYCIADLYENEQVDFLLKYLKINEFSIDIFIHSAGKSIYRSIYKSLDRFHDFTRTNQINYLAPVKIILAILPSLQKNKGQIISISAMNILFPSSPFWASYEASKIAFNRFLESIETEINKERIEVSILFSPLVRTRMIEPNEKYKKFPAMKPEQVAQIICRRITDRKRKWKPWWGIFAQIFTNTFEFLFKKIAYNFYK